MEPMSMLDFEVGSRGGREEEGEVDVGGGGGWLEGGRFWGVGLGIGGGGS